MALATQSLAILRFGTFEVDLRAGELRKQGKRIKLQDQPFQVLAVLLQRPGDVVTREELRSKIWPEDTFVDFDNSLNTAINKLREALGDSADNPRFIETLPRRGYRFLLPVSRNDHAGSAVSPSANVVSVSTSAVWKVAALMVIAALVGLASGIFFWRSRKAQRLTEKDTIVLADFTNTTGDPIFDDTLKQGLRVQLEQSPFLNVLSDQQVDQQLKLMARTAGERLTPDLARDLCQRIGSKAVLNATISSLGTHYVIGLNALNCHTGQNLASEQVEADTREHVLNALGQSATKIRHRLGESLVTIQKYDAPIEQATTSSLEALQAYSLGQKTWFAKGATPSIPFFKRAIELDPNFAMAYGRLGVAYGPTGEDALSIQNTRRAYELRGSVSEHERLYIESHYYHYATAELSKAAQVYELWEQVYPRDSGPHDNLEAVYADLGNHEKALEESLQAVRLAPEKVSSYEDVSRSYLRLNRLNEAQAALDSAAQHGLDSGWLVRSRFEIAFLRGHTAEMQKLAASGAGRREGLLLYLQGYVQAYHGRLRDARQLWRRSQESLKDSGLIGFAGVVGAEAAIGEALLGDFQRARADIHAALNLSQTPQIRAITALGLAFAGDERTARKLVSELSKEYPPDSAVQRYSLASIGAVLALQRKDANRTIELLNTMGSYEWAQDGMAGLDPIYLRGQAYLMMGNGNAAAVEFQKIVDHPGLVLENPVGALAHLQLGRAYALQGDTVKARTAYQDFLTLWKDADPEIPVLQQAKAEYAKLN